MTTITNTKSPITFRKWSLYLVTGDVVGSPTVAR